MAQSGYLYYAHTMPGLEEVAWDEIRGRLAGASFEAFKTLRGKNGLVLFRYGGNPKDLLSLRTVEDAFFLVAHISKVSWGHEGLSHISRAMAGNRFIDRGLAQHRELWQHGRRGTRTFRVISRMAGGRQPYRRVDLQRVVQRALQKRLGKHWRAVDEGEDVEIWVNLLGRDFVCGLRLSDASMRHRGYKQAHIEASLRPSVAAALVWLTDPRPGDVFLDPLCGAGTVLIERGMIERHGLLLGGDIDRHALQAAAENVGPRHKPRALLRWDAGRLPLASGSVDRLATNLPFGKKVGSHQENLVLYRAFFREMNRVLRAQGRAVVLSSESELVRDSLRAIDGLGIVRGYTVTLLGRKATVYLVARSN